MKGMFLFNAFNTIRALYVKDQSLADKTPENFSAYLQQNPESLKSSELISVTKEPEHTRLYTEIEVLRFPNVHVEYRIIDKEFRIPALSIQPLVENAIRHGVCGLRDGHAAVTTVREDDFHLIIVEVSGTGFDPAQQKDQVKEHIGFKIVKERIEQMCGQ